jgi:hypothetical protein
VCKSQVQGSVMFSCNPSSGRQMEYWLPASHNLCLESLPFGTPTVGRQFGLLLVLTVSIAWLWKIMWLDSHRLYRIVSGFFRSIFWNVCVCVCVCVLMALYESTVFNSFYWESLGWSQFRLCANAHIFVRYLLVEFLCHRVDATSFPKCHSTFVLFVPTSSICKF